MLRQVSSRNHRSKGGLKLKNSIQMGILVAICLWLLYQMKHSHDKKQAYVQRESWASSHVEEDRIYDARFGRKSLPHIREINPEEEDAEAFEHEIKHEANDEKNDHHIKTGSQVQENFDKGSSHEENKNGKDGSSMLEVQEHEEESHEAREKSFRGDNASSEVVHDPHESEHDEASHEAQERRFNGDDASSAVEHFTEVNESESAGERNFKDDEVPRFVEHFSLENESESESETEAKQNSDDRPQEYLERRDREAENMSGLSSKGDSSLAELLDTSEGSNSSVGNKDESSPDRTLSSNATKVESITGAEENPEGKTEVVRNVEQLIHLASSVNNNRTELATSSTYGSEDQINIPMNSSAVPQSHFDSQKMVVDLETNLAYPQGQIAVSHTPQDQNASAIKTPGDNYTLEATYTVTKVGAIEESSKSPSETNENRKGMPFDIRPSSHGADEEEEQKDDNHFNLENIQNKADTVDLEAAQ